MGSTAGATRCHGGRAHALYGQRPSARELTSGSGAAKLVVGSAAVVNDAGAGERERATRGLGERGLRTPGGGGGGARCAMVMRLGAGTAEASATTFGVGSCGGRASRSSDVSSLGRRSSDRDRGTSAPAQSAR